MSIKYLLSAAGLCIVLAGGSAALAQTAQMQQTAQCVLASTRDTRAPLALQMIQHACNDMVINTGDMFVQQRAYDQCLLDHLSGAQSNAAALQIQSACRTAYPRF
jgi:hypothetical protein